VNVFYHSGEEVLAGDTLGPKVWPGSVSDRVVVVIPTCSAVDGYVADDWAYLKGGIVVEHTNSSGTFIVHYPEIDEDHELLARAAPGQGAV
jgi:hypothetical protein